MEWPSAMVADHEHADDVVADLLDDRVRERGEGESSDAALLPVLPPDSGGCAVAAAAWAAVHPPGARFATHRRLSDGDARTRSFCEALLPPGRIARRDSQ